MKRFWWAIILLLILVAISPFIFKSPKTAKIIIEGKTFNVEVADDEVERAKGLSGRDFLAADSGMLFVFENSDIHTFWMKDTKIPLDIIFINDNKIVEMMTLQPPANNNIPSYTPQNKAQYVLELNAGFGFKVGDEVKIELIN